MISSYLDMSGTKKTLLEKQYEYIKASEKLRTDITKETDLLKMLDLSLLCISCSIGDIEFYKQNKRKIDNILFSKSGEKGKFVRVE